MSTQNILSAQDNIKDLINASTQGTYFTAKTAVQCAVCDRMINVGDAMTWNRKAAGERWHAACKDEGMRRSQQQTTPTVAVTAPVVAPTPAINDRMATMLAEMRQIVREELAAQLAEDSPVAAPAVADAHVHYMRDEALELVALGMNVYLQGAAGSGKTHVAQQIADILQLPLTPMQFDGFTSPILIKGYMDAQGKFSSTPVYEWLKSSGGILFVDEFDRGREDTLVCFNSLLANKYQMFANGELLRMGKNHIIIAAGNTAMRGSDGVYTSARKQDASVLDRFVSLVWDYDKNLELALAAEINADLGVKWAKWIHAVRVYVANPASGIKAQVLCGMRSILYGAKMLTLPRYQANYALVVERALFKGGVDAATIQRILHNVPLPR